MSVNTVRKYPTDEGAPCYKRRAAKASKLDPFMDLLRERVGSARSHWIPATVLYREVRERGFAGSERLVSNFVLRESLKKVSTRCDADAL
jgi:transposase